MGSARLPFIDWMKAIGMALIVFGHVAGATGVMWTPPFYLKQLGVVCFVFVTGFTLVREKRQPQVVVFNRYFDVLFFAAFFALVLSVVGIVQQGDPAQSNYLPLVGMQIVLNEFPANPTTWYVGTYLHLLVFWALVLRRMRVTLATFIWAALLEIAVRAAGIALVGSFFAYMLLFNWTGVLLLGMWFGGGQRAKPLVIAALGFIVLWPMALALTGWTLSFPFMELTGASVWASAIAVSVGVTVAYCCYGLAAYGICGRLPESSMASFFARNSLVVFIAHMPLYYVVRELTAPVSSHAVRVGTDFLVCFVLLSVFSEGLRRVLPVHAFREVVRGRVAWLQDTRIPSNQKIESGLI